MKLSGNIDFTLMLSFAYEVRTKYWEVFIQIKRKQVTEKVNKEHEIVKGLMSNIQMLN